MNALSASQILTIARQHLQAGRGGECESLCRSLLKSAPKDPDALHLLSLALAHRGQDEAAISYLKRAIAIADRMDLHRNLGAMHARREEWEPARASYQRAIDLAPQDTLALLGLGRALLEGGDSAGACSTFERVLAIDPGAISASAGLADAAHRAGDAARAIAICRDIAVRHPDAAEIQMRLGEALLDTGEQSQGMAALRRAAELAPASAEAAGCLGDALAHAGEQDQAIAHLHRATALHPVARRFVRLGNALLDAGRDAEATEAFAQAIARKPADVKLLAEFGRRDSGLSGFEWLIAGCRTELKRDPENAAAWFGLGIGHQGKRQVDLAADAYRHCLALDPTHSAAMNNLAMLIKDQGEVEPAIELLRRAADILPQAGGVSAESLSNYIYALHFSPKVDVAFLAGQHRRWDEQFGELLRTTARAHANAPDPGRRLRIGYVSPNFCEHPVARFLLGFFPALDHAAFETFCYSSVRSPDRFTQRLKPLADHWLECRQMSDAALAARIRADGIDILIDLTMHMANNRMLLFARRPAPVQISYLAYCSTTGLPAIDYRLTDPFLDPPGHSALPFPEQPLHLTESYWCYTPGEPAPEPGPLPALANGFVTFASFNNFCKVSPQVRLAWQKLLLAVPRSRLLVHAYPGSHREKFIQEFTAAGIGPERIAFTDFLELPDYFTLHQKVDLALDTFPYPGGTTTCDALWMGVPVISLAGDAPFTRAGLSILSNVGLPECVAFSEAEYFEKAVQFSTHSDRLAEMRAGLRERMRASPLMNAIRFSSALQACYRGAWRRWCEAKH